MGSGAGDAPGEWGSATTDHLVGHSRTGSAVTRRSKTTLDKKRDRLDEPVEHRSIGKAACLWPRVTHALTATADR
jgi:hypothetical protein